MNYLVFIFFPFLIIFSSYSPIYTYDWVDNSIVHGSDGKDTLILVSGNCHEDGCSFIFKNKSGEYSATSSLPDGIVEFYTDNDGVSSVKPEFINRPYVVEYSISQVYHVPTDTHEEQMLISSMTSPSNLQVLDQMIHYAPRNLSEKGIMPAVVKGSMVTGEFTEMNPLIYGAFRITGEFRNGLPVGTIVERTTHGEMEYYFNNNELVKYVARKTRNNGQVEEEIIEFKSKCPIKYKSPRQTREYQNGQIVKSQEFFPNGAIYKESSYVYDEAKKIQCNYDYAGGNIYGKKSGTSREYDLQNRIQREFNYLNDEKHGTCTEYENGRVKKVQNYQNGVMHGKYFIYSYGYNSKNLIQEGEYVNGKREWYKLYERDGTFKLLKD